MAGCEICLGFVTPSFWAATQTLGGSGAAGRWKGIQNFFGNFAGIISTYLTN